MIGLKTKHDFHLHNCPHQEIRISFPLFFLELLKQNTINSLMILQNLLPQENSWAIWKSQKWIKLPTQMLCAAFNLRFNESELKNVTP